MSKLKYPPFGKQVHQRLINGNTPDPFKVYPLFFFFCPEVHVFNGDEDGWQRAKSWNNAGYLVLVMPENESPEQYQFPVLSCFVFLHLSVINKEVTTLLGMIVQSGCLGYQLLLYSYTPDTPASELAEVFGIVVQKSPAVLHQEYYSRTNNNG